MIFFLQYRPDRKDNKGQKTKTKKK
ncbi:hypothetical protein C5167_022975 [Papaver somniferum]|uniref:Uncharacterized protein n=1 Tax=Papaver somniferum TaxID=3469 RepID=A0A4Y7JKD1_PAPSO|nr:hypothetical protein C5167_022975 [Papaver somniferum]